MTLAIAVKGTEGLVLAVDSRVTLQIVTQQQPQGTRAMRAKTWTAL
jgi:20S proteasome alpha/beta subunit